METRYTARAIVVVATGDQAQAVAAAAAVAPGGGGTFHTPVYDDAGQAAGYICNWQMMTSEAVRLRSELTLRGVRPLQWADCDDWDPVRSRVTGESVMRELRVTSTAPPRRGRQ